MDVLDIMSAFGFESSDARHKELWKRALANPWSIVLVQHVIDSVPIITNSALKIMLHEFAREAATRFAAKARPDSTASLSESIDRAYRIALTRSPDTEELAAMETFIHLQREPRGAGVLPPRSPQGDGEKASELAFVDFCHLVLCMNEFIYVN